MAYAFYMKKRKAASSTKRATRRVGRSKGLTGYTIISRRYIIGIAGAAVLLLLLVITNKHEMRQAVAGISVARPLFAEATVTWNKVDGAAAYNIYYKQYKEGYYTNAVRGVSADLTYYTISYLSKGKSYQYKVAAVDGSGKEFSITEETEVENIHPM